jgi:predicted lysophospholipase L1 biosynthesis ABC-type transport system permease subunit
VVAGTVGGSARFAVDLFYRINGSTVVTRGKRGYYSRGSPYNAQVRAPISTELDLTIGDYIEIGTKVQDADGTYTVNTINADCEVILRRMS